MKTQRHQICLIFFSEEEEKCFDIEGEFVDAALRLESFLGNWDVNMYTVFW